jgi:transmembrane sensor
MTHAFPADEPISEEVTAQAAAWIALRYGPEKVPASSAAFQRWLDANATHRLAFDWAEQAINEIRDSNWQDVESDLAAREVPRAGRHNLIKRISAGFGAILTVTLLFGVLYNSQTREAERFITGAGEQRHVALKDGTRMVLNAATEVDVTYDQHSRHVSLRSGEARFSVIKDESWPFIVTAGNHEVRAVGTRFLVQEIGASQTAVTLMEGSVTVAADSTGWRWLPSRLSRLEPQIMNRPGQRFTFTDHDSQPRADNPNLEQLLVWRTANVHFNGLALADAAAEMSRDSAMKIRIVEADAAGVPVSGSYKAGDLDTFAKTVALQFGLRVDRTAKEIVLYGHPKLPHRGALAAQ